MLPSGCVIINYRFSFGLRHRGITTSVANRPKTYSRLQPTQTSLRVGRNCGREWWSVPQLRGHRFRRNLEKTSLPKSSSPTRNVQSNEVAEIACRFVEYEFRKTIRVRIVDDLLHPCHERLAPVLLVLLHHFRVPSVLEPCEIIPLPRRKCCAPPCQAVEHLET